MARLRIVAAGFVLLALSQTCAAADKADDIAREIEPLMGTSWYGVYYRGEQKWGFAKTVLERQQWRGQEAYSVRSGLAASITMGGAAQKMVVGQKRFYSLTGEPLAFESVTDSILGKTEILGEFKGDKLVVTSTMAGRTSTSELPAPAETIDSVLVGWRLVVKGEVGATAQFEMFEATINKSVTVTQKLLRFEDRFVGGLKTRVAVIETTSTALPTSTDYVTTDGKLLETVVGSVFTLRREPENIAKDVKTSFDALRAGIIPVKEQLGDPRRLKSLRLKLSGVANKGALINDERQSYGPADAQEGDWHMLTVESSKAPRETLALPLALGPDEKEISRWLRPSTFAQSDAPEIVAAAREIVGDATDSFEAACRIQKWVYQNVNKVGLAAISNALAVLKAKEGDCSEHSVLFVALCRAAGIPAREAVGIGYSREMQGFGFHAWGEVYVGKWVAMDPTWGQDLVDASHIKFGIGETESMAVIGDLFGSLEIQVIEFER